MALPAQMTKGNFDDGAVDKPKTARAEFAANVDRFNELLAVLGNLVEGDVGDGLEIVGGFLRAKLADATLLRSAAGLAANMNEVWWSGDIKLSLAVTPRAGWIFLNPGGTIGDAASGGTARANADTQALFVLIWSQVPNSLAPIQTSAGGASTRGASAIADYNAHKRMPLPNMAGRTIAIAGTGAGLTGRFMYDTWGTETVTLAESHLPPHFHLVGDHTHGFTAIITTGTQITASGGGLGFIVPGAAGSTTGGMNGVGSVTTNAVGGGAAHANTQPNVAVNCFVKL